MACSTSVDITCSHLPGFLVGVRPREPEDVGEEPLGQAVAAHHPLGQFARPGGELDLARSERDQTLDLDALDHLRHRRSGDVEPVCDAGLDDVHVVLVQLEQMHSQYSSKARVVLCGRHAASLLRGGLRPRWRHGAIEQTFRDRTPASAEHAAAARRVMPGGGHAAAGHHPPPQLTIVKGAGPWLTDLDGNRYVDLIGNFTPRPRERVPADPRRRLPPWTTARTGPPATGTPSPLPRRSWLACRRSSGSASPTRAASRPMVAGSTRVATGRRKVLMALTATMSSAPHFECGTFGHEGPDTLLATYGDPGAFEAVLREHGAEIAAVILEPVMGSAGLVAAKADELERIGRAAQPPVRCSSSTRSSRCACRPAERRPSSASCPT